MTSIDVEELAEVFVEITDTLVDDFELIDFLELVTTHSASMSRSASAGLLLADPQGRLQFAAASEESVMLLELFQLQNREGPCLECFVSGSPVVNYHLDRATDRWPVFAPRAVSAGFHSVHAFPLRHRKDVIGALNLFSDDTGRLEPADVRIIQALTDLATLGLLQERNQGDEGVVVERLQGALTARTMVEQAKGVLARKRRITIDAASELMHDYARRNHQGIGIVARAVLANPGLIQAADPDKLLTPAEVAEMFRVDPRTITRWAETRRLTTIRTLGGHRRYLSGEVKRLLNADAPAVRSTKRPPRQRPRPETPDEA